MTVLVTEAEAAVGRPSHRDLTERLFEPSGSTLEDAILGAWEDLSSNGRTACPVCSGELELSGCPTCGSALS